jgi:histidinol-phosphate aminotransferase
MDFCELAVPGVRGLHPYQPGKPVEELEREYGIRDAVKLASNENPLGPSPKALQAIGQELPRLSRYPDGNGFALKQALADRHGVTPEQITLGNGSNDILELVTRAFISTAHEVVFSQHAFAVYPIVTQAVGARAVVVKAHEHGHDLPAMAAAITDRCRLVFVANPNNPTGTWSTVDALRKFLRAVPDNVIVVVDEAYAEYVQHADYPDMVPWIQAHPNLVVTRTFSKAFGLAGLRVGYSVSHPAVADLLNRVRQPFNVNSLAQAAALAALGDTQHLRRSQQLNRDGLQQLIDGFGALDLPFIDSVGNFICVNVKQPGARVYEQLLRRGVIVRPVDNYELPSFVRVSVGLPEENARFLQALAEVVGPAAAASGQARSGNPL